MVWIPLCLLSAGSIRSGMRYARNLTGPCHVPKQYSDHVERLSTHNRNTLRPGHLQRVSLSAPSVQ